MPSTLALAQKRPIETERADHDQGQPKPEIADLIKPESGPDHREPGFIGIEVDRQHAARRMGPDRIVEVSIRSIGRCKKQLTLIDVAVNENRLGARKDRPLVVSSRESITCARTGTE